MKTVIKVGSELIWLWGVAIEIESKEIMGISISKEQKNMFVAIEQFMPNIIDEYGEHPVSIADDGGTWYPPQQACQFLKIKHHIHSPYESIIIEMTMQYQR